MEIQGTQDNQNNLKKKKKKTTFQFQNLLQS